MRYSPLARNKLILLFAILLLLALAGGGYLYTLILPLSEVMPKANDLMRALQAHDIAGINAVSCSHTDSVRIATQWHLLESKLGRARNYRFVQARRVLMWGDSVPSEGSLSQPRFEVEYAMEFAFATDEAIVLVFRREGSGYCAESVEWWQRP